MVVNAPSPDLLTFQSHVASAEFRAGVLDGYWELDAGYLSTWPYVFIWISSASRDGAPEKFCFRFDCKNYPVEPVTGSLWNPTAQCTLEPAFRPKGRGRVQRVFRWDWEGGRALYHPFDRTAIKGHGNWATKHPDLIWSRSKTIVDLISELHTLLNCGEYEGI